MLQETRSRKASADSQQEVRPNDLLGGEQADVDRPSAAPALARKEALMEFGPAGVMEIDREEVDARGCPVTINVPLFESTPPGGPLAPSKLKLVWISKVPAL
jgi:hypothetical protein